jgi:hypothetical protein
MSKSNGNSAQALMEIKPAAQPAADGWLIDLNGIKAKDRGAFQSVWAKVQEMNDDALLYPWLAKVIKVWPFAEFDPANPDSYGELGILQHREAFERFAEAFRSIIPAVETPANGGNAGS